MKQEPLLSIGEVAERTGVAVSHIRFYSSENLINAVRSAGGQRYFRKSEIRRVSFILLAQQLGYGLDDIRGALSSLPSGRSPTKSDWDRLSRRFGKDLDERIAALRRLKETLNGCIGCGCLSLRKCALYNPDDSARKLGKGPRYLMGDQPPPH